MILFWKKNSTTIQLLTLIAIGLWYAIYEWNSC